VDREQAGPGVVRNHLLAQVTTPYVSFLDADDWLEPDFAEQTLNAMRPGRYVYTDWYQDNAIVAAPEKAWCGGTWHIITGVLRTEQVKQVGGFNETLPALEDTDFWLKLVTRRVCGIRVNRPLVHYSKDGLRAKSARQSGLEVQVKTQLLTQYGGQMGCCGENSNVDTSIPLGAKQEGDVLAVALWSGNRSEYGRVTGRRYPRMSYPRVTWIDPRDLRARTELWEQVSESSIDDPLRYSGLNGFARALQQTGVLNAQADTHDAPPPFDGSFKPDVDKVNRIAQKRLKVK